MKQRGPLRRYSARPLERTIGVYSRRIKSKVAPGVNAGNEMVGIAALQDHDRQEKENAPPPSQDPEPSARNSVYAIGQGDGDEPELWGIVRDANTIESFKDLNLARYLQQLLEAHDKQRKSGTGVESQYCRGCTPLPCRRRHL